MNFRAAVPYMALAFALVAFVMASTGVSIALPGASTKPKKFGILRLDKKKKFPPSVIPTVRNAKKVGGKSAKGLTLTCPATTLELDTYCIDAAVFPLDKTNIGKNDFFFASQKCVEAGGFLPDAATLIGAADRLKLSSTIDDSQLTATIDLDATDGLRDRREMTSTLVTTAAGGTASGSQGVTDGSRGDPKQGEPDPVPLPADPAPETLQYVTVYDNKDKGGFAGSKPISQPESFRCAFPKLQGPQKSGSN